MPAPTTGGRVVAIEALRGAAALSVAIVHSLGAAAAAGAGSPALLGLPFLAGVDVFFVVSGFVMVHSSARWFGVPGGRRRFVAHRIARVVPLYWAVTTAFVLSALLRPTAFTDPLDGWRTVLASYLFIPWSRPDGSVLPVFRLGWTLEYEALFYGLLAVWMGWSRRIATAGLFLSLITLAGLGQTGFGLPQPFAFWTDPIILEFTFGMALAVAHAAGLRVSLWLAPVMMVTGIALLVRAGGLQEGWARPVAYGLPAALLVALALLREQPLLGQRLRWLALQAGGLSYALYLCHLFAVRAVREAARFVPLPTSLFVSASVALSVALAILAHRVIERPALAAVRRRLG